MSNFMSSGNTVNVISDDSLVSTKRLPTGCYIAKVNREGAFYLETAEPFLVSSKLYGNLNSRYERIMNTYLQRASSNKNTGVLLTGEKGSGKSLLAKKLSVEGMKADIPTVIVNEPFVGDTFSRFLQLIDHECIIIFDEFEKIYDAEAQERLLTIFDGVFQSKKLFVLTCNLNYRIDDNLLNRPGRMYYSIEYKGISDQFIREYCEDNLLYKNYTDSICNLASVFENFNFDMLAALVEEINRYNESPSDVLKMLNIKVNKIGETLYDMVAYKDGVELELLNTKELANPIRQAVEIYYNNGEVKTSGLQERAIADDDYDERLSRMKFTPEDIVKIDSSKGLFRMKFTPEDIVKIDSSKGLFVYEKDGFQLKLTRFVRKDYDLAF